MKRSVILIISLFALQAFTSPRQPFGIFKRAPGEENQNDGSGGNFYAAYGDWPNSETHGPQLSDWNTPSVTTTEGPLETSTIFPQYSWKTTTAQASAITSSKISVAHETTEKRNTSRVNETHRESCSLAPTSTIYKTIFGTVQRQTVLSTITEIQTQTGAGCTVTQQFPTTILSIVASQGSCTPAGPVIPPTTVTQKEMTTIFSTIVGPTITSTQIVTASGQTRVITQSQHSTQYQVSTVKFVYTETEWSAATATVKSPYTETETVTRTQFSTLSGPTITSTQYQVSTMILPVGTCITELNNNKKIATETSTVYQGQAVTQIETYTCTETETLVSTALVSQQTLALKTEFYTSIVPTTVYQTQVKTIISTYTARPFTTAIISTVSEVQTITASASCTQGAPVIPCSAATSTLTVTQTILGQHITVTETGQRSCSAIFPSTVWSTMVSTARISCASPTNFWTTILPCTSPSHETVTVTASTNCTQVSTTVTVTSTKQASCSPSTAQTKIGYSTIVSTVQASCASPTHIVCTSLPSRSSSQETMTVTVSGSCTQAGPVIPSATIIVTSMERASCSSAIAQTIRVYSTIISTAQVSCGSQIYTQAAWATKIETQPGHAPTPEIETAAVVATTTAIVESQTLKGPGWASSASSQNAPPVYGATSAWTW